MIYLFEEAKKKRLTSPQMRKITRKPTKLTRSQFSIVSEKIEGSLKTISKLDIDSFSKEEKGQLQQKLLRLKGVLDNIFS